MAPTSPLPDERDPKDDADARAWARDVQEGAEAGKLTSDADWVNVETTISTAADQIAVAPGSLIKEWTEGDRRFFHYKLDHKAWNFYAFMSARYEVAREEKDGIQFEVYYHKDHAANVPRMMKSMQKSLEYYIAHFGPYYQKQCRIIEFTRVASFAKAFPGTMP